MTYKFELIGNPFLDSDCAAKVWRDFGYKTLVENMSLDVRGKIKSDLIKELPKTGCEVLHFFLDSPTLLSRFGWEQLSNKPEVKAAYALCAGQAEITEEQNNNIDRAYNQYLDMSKVGDLAEQIRKIREQFQKSEFQKEFDSYEGAYAQQIKQGLQYATRITRSKHENNELVEWNYYHIEGDKEVIDHVDGRDFYDM